MRIETAPSWPVSIFIAGEQIDAERICSDFCDEVGLCVTVTATEYIYTGGWESGVTVGFINYPRFPKEAGEIEQRALELAQRLREGLGQESFSIQTPDETTWYSWRAADNAIGMETRRAETTGSVAKP